jgi:hypothetical protein
MGPRLSRLALKLRCQDARSFPSTCCNREWENVRDGYGEHVAPLSPALYTAGGAV